MLLGYCIVKEILKLNHTVKIFNVPISSINGAERVNMLMSLRMVYMELKCSSFMKRGSESFQSIVGSTLAFGYDF